jgi:hypothetical protein
MLTRRNVLIVLLALVPVLAGGAVGALAGGILPGNDLVVTVPTGTDVSAAARPAIDTVAGVADVGLEEDTPFSGVRRPSGALLAGPPQESGNPAIGPQLVGPDGTITAIWSSAETLHAARLAPGATSWTNVANVGDATIGAEGAVIAPDGTITAITFTNLPDPSLVSRRLLPGSTTWEAPKTIESPATGTQIKGEPELIRSPAGVVMAGWSQSTAGNEEVGGALQAANGTWPEEARSVVSLTGERLSLGAIALPATGRSGRLIINDFKSGRTPPIKSIAEQINDSGTIPMASVPTVPQGDGSFITVAAAFAADGTLRIIGLREGGLSESDVPTTNSGTLPGAAQPIAEFGSELAGGRPVLATLPGGEMLLSYAPEDETAETQTVELLSRPVGAGWSAPKQLQAPISTKDGGVGIGGIAVDAGGDAYITWSTLVEHKKATLSGAILDNSPPVIDGLSLPGAVAGQPVGLGVSAHDAWSATTAHWDFGDGTSGDGTNPTHVYATAGPRTVTVTVTDAAGNQATSSGTVNVAAAPPGPVVKKMDKVKPKLAIAQPTCPKKLSAADCRKRRAASSSWHVVGGTVSDAGGIASVVLQATSGAGKKCTVLAAKGKAKEAPCAKAAKLKATIKGGRWSVKTPGIGKGAWKLTVLATDRAGNRTTTHLTLHLTS